MGLQHLDSSKTLGGRGAKPWPLIVITGPTASGKTRRAVNVAQALNGEILSADSRQVYRQMTIGTGKDLEEYGDVPVHLIDIRDAGYKYNLHEYLSDFHESLKKVRDRERIPILCGGSGMYVEAAISGILMPQVDTNASLRKKLLGKTLEELTEILSGYKTLHNRSDVDTVARAIRAIEIEEYYRLHPEARKLSDRSLAKPLEHVIIAVDISRQARRERISRRLRVRLEQGMVEEVEQLLNSGINPSTLIAYGLEYKFITMHLLGTYTYDEMVKLLETAIHQFAKRQMTWFRGMQRRGFTLNWLPETLSEEEFTHRAIEIYKKSIKERNANYQS